jgi:phosphoglycolate phosphatase
MATATAAIFDLDGTLVDTLDDLTAALNHVLAHQGYPLRTRDECRRFIGDGARIFMERAMPATAREDAQAVDAVMDGFRVYYTAHLIERSRLYDGIATLLDALEQSGIPKAIVSNKPDDMTHDVVQRLLIRWQWALVTGDRPGQPRKPDPTGAQRALEALKVDPAQCLFVGDSGIDMATGRRASLIPVGVLWGFRDAAELEAQGAQHLVSTPVELGPLLGCH